MTADLTPDLTPDPTPDLTPDLRAAVARVLPPVRTDLEALVRIPPTTRPASRCTSPRCGRSAATSASA